MLADLQRLIGDAVRRPPGEAGGAAAALRPLPRLAARETLDLYRESISATRDEALASLYPVCAALVGAACMRGLRVALEADGPARHPDLAQLGDRLPERIAELDFVAGVPYLADVARLERAWQRAFVAPPPTASVDPEGVARALGAEPERWRFVLPPSATLLASPHPILAIWRAHQDDAPEGALERVRAGSEPDRLIVWRREDDVCVHAVEAGLWPLLEQAAAGRAVAAWLDADPADTGEDSCSRTGADRVGDLELGRALTRRLEAIGLCFERGWLAGAEPVRHGGPT